jgi:hypothetical protein
VSALVDGHTAVVDAVGGVEWEVQPKLFTTKGMHKFIFSYLDLLPF